MKKSFKVAMHIDPKIKEGDYVLIHDGSGISCDVWDQTEDKPLYIVNAYPLLTGMGIDLQKITGKVIETNITNRVCISSDYSYLQDIVVQLGDGLFRTPSKFVHKI